MKNNKSLFEEIVSDVVENIDNETTRRQKAQKSIQGKNKNVKSLAILSAENPLGNQLGNAENNELRKSLENYCTNGHYPWFRIKGKYGNEEKSHIIYNITLSDAIIIGQKFNQESIIYVIISDDGQVNYQYWEQPNHDGEFEKTHERSNYIDMTDADDFYSTIGRSFKFQIPFFDGNDEIKNEVNEHINKINELVNNKHLSNDRYNRYMNNLIDENKTSHCRYNSRGSLF